MLHNGDQCCQVQAWTKQKKPERLQAAGKNLTQVATYVSPSRRLPCVIGLIMGYNRPYVSGDGF